MKKTVNQTITKIDSLCVNLQRLFVFLIKPQILKQNYKKRRKNILLKSKPHFLMKKRHEQKLVILSMLVLLALNIPLLLLFDSSKPLFGFPIIYIYIFSAWLFSIATSYLIIKRYYEQHWTLINIGALLVDSFLHCLLV